MSAVAAVAVASPCAYFLVYESTAGTKAPEHHDFKQAAVVTDLPNELIGALSQGLSQFGVNLPPVPALSGATAPASTGLGTTPGSVYDPRSRDDPRRRADAHDGSGAAQPGARQPRADQPDRYHPRPQPHGLEPDG